MLQGQVKGRQGRTRGGGYMGCAPPPTHTSGRRMYLNHDGFVCVFLYVCSRSLNCDLQHGLLQCVVVSHMAEPGQCALLGCEERFLRAHVVLWLCLVFVLC
jgi:hypothetical protein